MNKFLLALSSTALFFLASCPEPNTPLDPNQEPNQTAPDVSPVAPQYAWVQMGPDAKVIVRAITQDAQCPYVTFYADTSVQMDIRAAKAEGFPLSCEKLIPADAKVVDLAYKNAANALETLHLRLPSYDPTNIAVLGDTGCDTGSKQVCSDAKKWPFAAIAKGAAQSKPNLAIHVGDYVYRDDHAKRDTWEVWEADFFKPVKLLLSAAPMVFLRGNHEQCKEAFKGWFRYLDPFPYDSNACKTPDNKTSLGQIMPSYAVEFGALKMLVLDSSAASDTEASQTSKEAFGEEFKKLNNLAIARKWNDAWLLTHRVTWGCAPGALIGISCSASGDALRAGWSLAFGKSNPAGITKFLAGHVHLFSLATFSDTGPLQLIIGNSGAALNWTSTWNISDGSRTVAHNTQKSEFGYAVISLFGQEQGKDLWRVERLNDKSSSVEMFELVGNVKMTGAN